MKKNIKIIIGVIIIIVIALVLIFLLPKEKEENKEIKMSYELKPLSSFDICLDSSNCPFFNGKLTYAKMEVKTNVSEISDAVQKINKDTKKYYNESKNSKAPENSCQENAKSFKHSFHVVTDYYEYETNDYINIGVKRVTYDLCNGTENHLTPEIYIYDKDKGKMINQDTLSLS